MCFFHPSVFQCPEDVSLPELFLSVPRGCFSCQSSEERRDKIEPRAEETPTALRLTLFIALQRREGLKKNVLFFCFFFKHFFFLILQPEMRGDSAWELRWSRVCSSMTCACPELFFKAYLFIPIHLGLFPKDKRVYETFEQHVVSVA